MLFGDHEIGNRQPQTGSHPHSLSGKKRFKYPSPRLFFHAGTVILDFDPGPFAVPAGALVRTAAAGTVAEELALGRPSAPAAGDLAGAGLAGMDDRDPRVLSAGQKQRLALAVALKNRIDGKPGR